MRIISQLILCSLCFNSVLTKKIHSFASRAVQPSRSQYDRRYHRKKLWRPQPRSWRTPRSNPGFEHFSTWSKFVLDLYLRSQLVVLLHDVVHVVLCNIGSLVWLLCSDSFVQHFLKQDLLQRYFEWPKYLQFFKHFTKVVVGAGVVKIQLGGVQATRVSSPVSPNTLKMYLHEVVVNVIVAQLV